jgi:transaldolase/glucose-6-phosphate isomerase
LETKQTQRFTYSLGNYESQLNDLLARMREEDFVKRLWNKDKSLWTNEDENQWLGWLDITKIQLEQLSLFQSIAQEILAAGFTHAVLLGMGGSSLCVEVLRKTFGKINGFPQMIVLDSVVPAQIKAVEDSVDLKKTLCIVSSKSGSTTEPNVLCAYFYEQISKVSKRAGDHFIAITDPGSSLEDRAKALGFRRVFHGVPSIGGRYSVLSHFGMVPAAIMGLDVAPILHSAQAMTKTCQADATPTENPGLVLGAIMGMLAKEGRDKVTLIASRKIASLGTWLEQLIAESTGKQGRGIAPVDGEEIGQPEVYANDRLFAYICLRSEPDRDLNNVVKSLEQSGQPIVRIEIDHLSDLGGEFFRWQFATAVAGSVLGINAFNQPNVQESKDYTKKFLKQYVEQGSLPQDQLLIEDGDIKAFTDQTNKDELVKSAHRTGLHEYVQAHLSRIKPGDYFAITAYIEYDEKLKDIIEKMRMHVRDTHKVATTFGYGPRFLHSTGQLHKGGANTGVFLQITSDDRHDLPIPQEKYTFGILKQAQSLGDFLALSTRNRRALRIHIKGDLRGGLERIAKVIDLKRGGL